jgi:hypothetical protein
MGMQDTFLIAESEESVIDVYEMIANLVKAL